jgi:hypothetical protein
VIRSAFLIGRHQSHVLILSATNEPYICFRETSREFLIRTRSLSQSWTGAPAGWISYIGKDGLLITRIWTRNHFRYLKIRDPSSATPVHCEQLFLTKPTPRNSVSYLSFLIGANVAYLFRVLSKHTNAR